jgi:hypothetical protein
MTVKEREVFPETYLVEKYEAQYQKFKEVLRGLGYL